MCLVFILVLYVGLEGGWVVPCMKESFLGEEQIWDMGFFCFVLFLFSFFLLGECCFVLWFNRAFLWILLREEHASQAFVCTWCGFVH